MVIRHINRKHFSWLESRVAAAFEELKAYQSRLLNCPSIVLASDKQLVKSWSLTLAQAESEIKSEMDGVWRQKHFSFSGHWQQGFHVTRFIIYCHRMTQE